MAENSSKRNNNTHLNPPPEQTVHGVILYHTDPQIDNRIRQVRTLREAGYDVDVIAQTIERSQWSTYAYLRQIRLARLAYIKAFPEDFDSGVEALRGTLLERKDLDAMLRRELTKLQDDRNPSNRVGVYKLIMRNMRETEELAGLLIQRFEHGGEVTVKEELKHLLDQAPTPVREAYLDALSAVIAAAEQQQPLRQAQSD